MIINYARGSREVKFRISFAKATFNENTAVFPNRLVLNLRKKLFECHVWIIALYGAETLTLRKVNRKYLGSCEMYC